MFANERSEMVLGYLPGINEDGVNGNPVFINDPGELQFSLKVLSELPGKFQNAHKISGFGADLEDSWGLMDDMRESDVSRIENLRAFLQDVVIAFQIEQVHRQPKSPVYKAVNLSLLPKSELFFADYHTYKAVPVFSRAVQGIDFNTFLQRLRDRKPLGAVEAVDQSVLPPLVFWQDDRGQLTAFGIFENFTYSHGGLIVKYTEPLLSAPMGEEMKKEIYCNQGLIPGVLFIREEDYGILNGELAPFTGLSMTEAAPAVLDEAAEQPAPVVPAESFTADHGESDEDEKRFLRHLQQVTAAGGLAYAERDLINFHTAMKVSSIVILAGMSGTGKSGLVSAYCQALGLDDNHFAFIPVRPSWTDDTDLIGYPDLMHQKYRPGDSGLIDLLIKAEASPHELFMVSFDEMNLSKIEHYFSQFLSVMEQKEGTRRIRLYNDQMAQDIANTEDYPPTVTIGNNVLFAGTVNVDESTHHFSDKVLDRANVIRLAVQPFSAMKTVAAEAALPARAEDFADFYKRFTNTNDAIDLKDEEVDFLWQLHLSLAETDERFGIGPRVVRQIDYYLKNIPSGFSFGRREAFDLQIVQRVMTKIRGSEDQLASFMGDYHWQDKAITSSRFLKLTETFSSISDFAETRRVIKQKAKELKQNGYTF